MTPLQDLQRRLMAGAMICEYTDPRGHQMLCEEESRLAIARTLESLGYQLNSLGEGSVYFLCEQDTPSEAAVSQAMLNIMRGAGPIMQLFEALVRTAGDDRVFGAGAILDKPVLLARLSEQDTLSKNLKTVVRDMMRTNAKLDSNTAVLDRAFTRLEDEGYIKVEDRERERYRVTGKICYLEQVLDYIAEQAIIDESDETLVDQAEMSV